MARFIPAYEKAGYATYEHYLLSEEWEAKKAEIEKKYPKSRYCWVCDSTKYLNLHHENYWAIPNEKFLKDVFYLCRDCHKNVHFKELSPNTVVKTVLEVQHLRSRRLALRKEAIKLQTPRTLPHFLKRLLYRLFW